MKVSVLVLTYNHEKFISQAINSALLQETNFPFEIIVGEDFSTDRTRGIVLELEKAHPDKIRALFQDATIAQLDRAVGLSGKTNVVKSLAACRGEYIALLDGDDYWTDPQKLQRQIDFLDSHPDFAICFHNVSLVNEGDVEGPVAALPPDQKRVWTIEDLLAGNFMHACSVVFRGGLINEFPDWFMTLRIGDWPLHVMNAQHGKIGYLKDVMAAYRVHEGGFWSTKDRADQITETIKVLDHLDAYLRFKYRRRIKASKGTCFFQLAEIYHERGLLTEAKAAVEKCLRYSGFRNWPAVNLTLRLQAPNLYVQLLKLRDAASRRR